MLPLVSSITTTLIGWTSLSNIVNCWSTPLSSTSKCSRSRLGTSRPEASIADA